MKLVKLEDIKKCYPNIENNSDIKTIDFTGILDKADYVYQRKTRVKPLAVNYADKDKPSYIKYSCPVCKMLGNFHQLTKGEKNCPLCNVNLLWDNITKELSEEEVKEIKETIAKYIVYMYSCDLSKAISIIENSSFFTLLREHPDYVLHYNFEYWAKTILSEYIAKEI